MEFREAFRRISQYHDRSGSDTVLFSSVTRDDLENPSLEMVGKLAEKIGLQATVQPVSALRTGNADLPGLLMSSEGDWSVVVAYGDQAGHFMCADPEQPNKVYATSGQDLLGDKRQFISFSKIYLNDQSDVGLTRLGEIERQHWLRSAIAPYWRSFIRVGIAALCINLLALASPLFVMNVYDRVLPNEAISTLWVMAAGVGIAFLFDFLLKTARASLIDYTGRKIDLRIADVLFEKVLNTSMSARTMSTGEYANRVLQYEFVRDFFTSNTVATLIDSAFISVFIIVIYLIGGVMAFVPAAAVVAVIIVGLVAQKSIARRMAAASNEAALRNSLLVEAISTSETIKTLKAEPVMARKWRELSVLSSHTSEQIKSVSSTAVNATQFIQQLVSVGIILVGAYLFQRAEVTTGAIIASVILAGRAVAPLGQITMTLARLRQALLSLQILDKIMGQPEDTPTTVGFVNRTVKSGSLKFDNVTFRYPRSDQNALDGVSFSIKSGERVGIIGRIGSGKTTVGRLVGQIFVPDEGKVFYDGIDGRQYHPAEVRNAVAIAGQSSDLFTGSIKENLLLGNPLATDEELIDVAARVGIESFISRHPRGFDLPVGEAGCFLSSGQKQSVAIARLLLSRPKIIFLDEPSGAMDLASERQLLKCLRQAVPEDVTLLISTHRHSMLDLVDRLIVIDNGRILADGPKAAVLQALQRTPVPITGAQQAS